MVGSGVEAVINFFRDRGPKLLVQQDGVSLVNEEAYICVYTYICILFVSF